MIAMGKSLARVLHRGAAKRRNTVENAEMDMKPSWRAFERNIAVAEMLDTLIFHIVQGRIRPRWVVVPQWKSVP